MLPEQEFFWSFSFYPYWQQYRKAIIRLYILIFRNGKRRKSRKNNNKNHFGNHGFILAVFIAIKCGATELFKMDRSIETKVYDIKEEEGAFSKINKGYSNGIYAAKNYTEAYSNDLLLGRTALVENEVRYKNLIGWNLFAPTEYNSLLYLENGYLAGANKKESTETIQNIATKIKSLKDVSEEAGAEFIYMQTPGNIDKFGDEGINRVKDFANDNADALIADLKDYGKRVAIGIQKCLQTGSTTHVFCSWSR